MQLKDLTPNPGNPRKVTEKKLKQLKKSLEEFGDLSGFVFNRATNNLVGGHQRQKVLPPESEITIEFEHAAPTKAGTIAEGHVNIGNESFAYREVNWPVHKEKAANLAANKGAGEWDTPKLEDWFQDLQTGEFDLGLTMFEEKEFNKWITMADPWGPKPEPEPAQSGDGTFEGAVNRILLVYNQPDFEAVFSMAKQGMAALNCANMSELFKRLLEENVACHTLNS